MLMPSPATGQTIIRMIGPSSLVPSADYSDRNENLKIEVAMAIRAAKIVAGDINEHFVGPFDVPLFMN